MNLLTADVGGTSQLQVTEQNDLVLGDLNLNGSSTDLEGVIASTGSGTNGTICQAEHSRMSVSYSNLGLDSANIQFGASGTGEVVMADGGDVFINFTRNLLLSGLIDYSGPHQSLRITGSDDRNTVDIGEFSDLRIAVPHLPPLCVAGRGAALSARW